MLDFVILILLTVFIGILWFTLLKLSLHVYVTVVTGALSLLVNIVTGIMFALLMYMIMNVVIQAVDIVQERKEIVEKFKQLKVEIEEHYL